MKIFLTPARQSMLGITVIVIALAFWLSPTVGLLTLGAIAVLGVLYGIYCCYWLFFIEFICRFRVQCVSEVQSWAFQIFRA